MKFSTTMSAPRAGLTFALREVDGDGLLAAVTREVIRCLAGVASLRILQERWAPAARVVAAARLLDLDDLGAEIG